MKKTLVLFIVSVIVISCFFGKTLVMANAEENHPPRYRYYTNIEIQEGDTLWTIAEQYCENSGMDVREYVRELQKMNQLSNDHILAGDSLPVVYFTDTPLPGQDCLRQRGQSSRTPTPFLAILRRSSSKAA